MTKHDLEIQKDNHAIAILADDFTSAADAAVPFVAQGLSASVVREAEGKAKAKDIADVYALDCGSRLLNEAGASSVVRSELSVLLDCHILMKTIDSTLRGNVSVEIKTAIEIAFASGKYDRAVIAPAFPEAGRTTIRGVQYVDGILVAQSSYGLDPVHPARISEIDKLLDPDIGLVEIIPTNENAQENSRSVSQARLLILDAESQEDLDRLAARIDRPESVLWIGSPGLAQALAKLVASKKMPKKFLPKIKSQVQETAIKVASVLILAGSANEATRRQSHYLRKQGVSVEMNVMELQLEQDICCLSAPDVRSDEPSRVRGNLITQALRAINEKPFDCVIATGGETMVSFMEAMDIKGMDLLGELAPGFPLARVTDVSSTKPQYLAMKAGGFGAPDLLYRAVEDLMAGKRDWKKELEDV